MGKKLLRITESDLHNMVNETVNSILKEMTVNEAEDGGWVVDSSEAQEAYNMAVDEMGEEAVNSAIVRSLGNELLAQSLAYIFRQYDFRQWRDRGFDEMI